MMGIYKRKKERNNFFLPQWLEVMGRVFDIEDLCQQMFQFSDKINLSIFRWFAQRPLSVLRLVWGLSRIIHYRVNTAARDGICHSRHSRRECKIFASGVNFSRNNAVCYINESKKLHFTLISSQKLLTYY